MTFAQPTAQTRRLEPSWRPWTPEPYQLRGADHLKASGAAVLWLDPGMRKTSIVLKAFCDLQDAGVARKMLVIAPKKVCQLVWRQEAAKWEDFRHLNIVFLHGPKKDKRLREEADVYLMNPEGAVWLAKQYEKCPQDWPFDTVTFDELTKFKNSQSERSKALRGRTVKARTTPNLLKRAQRRWGMTGTPNPNGYMDLFGQFLALDDGAALGRFVTHYRDTYFSVGWNGFDYELQPGAEKRIQARLKPYVFALNAEDYIYLPELQDNLIEIELEPEAWAAYEAMRKEMVAALPEGVVEAANTAAAYNKLSQMAGGAVYMEDGSVQELHTAKLDALSDLMDEMGDRQLLIGYEFNHEKDRIKARLGNRVVFLSDARTDAATEQVQKDWNAGRIQFLACHPASAGHGLNFQEGGAAHLCWFSPIWDLELWDQFIRRLRRSGNTAERVVRHCLVVRNSIDELKLQATADKDISQSRLKRALTTVLSGEETEHRSQDMVMKLQRAGASATPAQDSGERKAPSGWGKPAPAAQENTQAALATEERKAPSGWGAPKGASPSEAQTQREEIRDKLNPETTSENEQSGFSAEVIALRANVEGGAGEGAPFEGGQPAQDPNAGSQAPKATRSRSTAPKGDTAAYPSADAAAMAVYELRAELGALRAEVALLNAGRVNAATPSPEDESRRAAQEERWIDEQRTNQLSTLLHGAKAAAEAVSALSDNSDAAGEAYGLLMGAVEKRLTELGYAA